MQAQGQVWMPAFPIMFTNTVATQGNMNMQGIDNFIMLFLKVLTPAAKNLGAKFVE